MVHPSDVIPMFSRTLSRMKTWLDKIEAHAGERGLDPNTLLEARLTPDQWPFARQVHAACDTAKFTAAMLAGVDPPVHDNSETSADQLRARIAAVRTYIDSFGPEQFAGFEERRCAPPWLGGKWQRGADYTPQYSIPDFFFFAVTAYSILRHNGVSLGKSDYLGPLSFGS